MSTPASSSTMIGREADLDGLRTVLADAVRGNTRGVVVGGEAGIGKTRLLREFTSHAASSALVLTGQCVDLGDAGPPFAPVTSVLRALVAELGSDGLLAAAGSGGDPLRVLLPELGPMPPELISDLNLLHEVLTTTLEVVSRDRPLVVVVEDVQWADDATLKVLQFVLRTMTSGRVMVLLSYRSDDVPRGHPLRAFLTGLERGRRIVRVELGRLPRAQVRDLAEAILGSVPDAGVLDRVYERSEGVPFFVEELLGLEETRPGAALPETLRDLLLARYERLTEPTQRVLRLIAVGGVRVRHDLLATVFTGSADELEVAAREAVGAHVLDVDEHSYTFRHALVREAVSSDLLPGERSRFHTRFAEELESGATGWGGSAEVAYHWYAAYNVPRAFPATLAAMSEALASFAFRTAAQLGERALEMWDQLADPDAIAGQSKSQLLAETAAALRDAGDGERALAMVDLAIAECPTGDGAGRAHLLGRKANYLANVGRPGSIALLREALDLMAPRANGSLRAALLSALSARLMIEGDLPEAIIVAREGLAEAQASGSHRHASVAANMLGLSRIHSGEVDGGMADIERARDLARGDHQALLRYLVNMSDLMHLVGRYDEALRIAEEGIVTARERGAERTSGVVLTSNAVDPLLALGRWDRAEELIDRIRAFEAPLAFRLYVHRAYIWLTLWRGDLDGAEELYRETRSAMTTLAGVETQTRLGVARIVGEIAAARGDLTGAWVQVEVVLAQDRPMPGHDLPLLFLGARVLGAMRAAGGSAGRAVDLEARERRLRELLARETFWPSAHVWTALFDAELGGAARDGSGTQEWAAAVDAVHVPAGQAYLYPYALLRLGQARLAAADRAGATRDLQAAVAAANRIGAGLIEGWANDLAARAGLRLTGDAVAARPPSSVLTARERQVLELIGQGLTNRQIGERLFITAKTASVHVSAILRKLGATSRTEAVFLGGQVEKDP